MEMPRQTADIFTRLSRGQLISANSRDPQQLICYQVLQAHEADLRWYFSHLGFRLERGPGYYYLSREEAKSSLEDKLARISRLIERIYWLKQVDDAVGPAYLLAVDRWLALLEEQPELRRKLRRMSFKGNPQSDVDRLMALLRELERGSFAEQVQDQPAAFRLLASFHYLEALLMRIGPK